MRNRDLQEQTLVQSRKEFSNDYENSTPLLVVVVVVTNEDLIAEVRVMSRRSELKKTYRNTMTEKKNRYITYCDNVTFKDVVVMIPNP